MCPCLPIDPADITVPSVPAGFGGLPVPQLPPFDIPFPPIPLEDLIDLFNKLNMVLPPGILHPHLSPQFSKNVIDAILSLLQAFMPFLMLYTFFMPLLNIILCVIEVLCAIANPFKLVRALRRLFRRCIPQFLSLFPFFALILMILALLLLILALIAYLIQRIIDLIRQIIANIELLAQAVESVDNDSVIAITIKLGDLLCIFQNLFVLLGVIAIMFEVIQRLLNLTFKIPPCDDGDHSDDGCCTPDVCPSFIKNNREIISNNGTLKYFNTVINTGGSTPETLRTASYQVYAEDLIDDLAFININNAVDLPPGVSKVFFPEGETYALGVNKNSIPYTIDVRIFYVPSLYGRNDPQGNRFIIIKDCIIIKKPTAGTLNYANSLVAPFNGTFTVVGGATYEADGITPMSGAGAGSLETLISQSPTIGVSASLTDNGITYSSSTVTLNINHEILIAKGLITAGCHPDLAFDKNFINNTIAARLNVNADALSNIVLPDVQIIQDTIINAINDFRTNVSIDSAQSLQDIVVGELTGLQNQTNATIENMIDIGFDPFKSDFVLDPSIQFTTKSIKVVVTLNEASGNNVANNLPASIASNIAHKLVAHTTFGTIGSFKYDGIGTFAIEITSKEAGNGSVSVSYNNQFISILNNPNNISELPSVSTKSLIYTFVQSSAIIRGNAQAGNLGVGSGDNNNVGGEPGSIRRDEGDVSRDGEEGNN